MARYYVDTCVWIDFVEGMEYAEKLFSKIIYNNDILIISKLILHEFLRYKSYERIAALYALLLSKNLIIRIEADQLQENEARILSAQRMIPQPDILHAIISRDNDALLITRDKHFFKLNDICPMKVIRAL
jgi:predicted nucleic acid-binding protein